MPMKSTLTVRLTVLYTLVAATVLSGLAVLVLMTTHQHFVELDQAFMLEKAKLCKAKFYTRDESFKPFAGQTMAMIFTKPSVSWFVLARELAEKGNLPTL